MLEVTNAALEHLRSALSQSHSIDETDECFRLVVQDDKIGLAVQSPESGDHTFETDGATVLAMPKAVSELLSERVLDLGDEGQLLFLPKPS
jgi:Fe-S cluster assembly iron-binding protein IscA